MKKFIIFMIISICMLSGCTANKDIIQQPESNSQQSIRMVMVDNLLFTESKEKSTVETRTGLIDGKILYSVAETNIPSKNDESNFGTGYKYQYIAENTIDIYINNNWVRFVTEDPKEDLEKTYSTFLTQFINWYEDLSFEEREQVKNELELIMDKNYTTDLTENILDISY